MGSLPPADSGAMLAAVLPAVKNDAELRDLAKVLRSEAKRHNSYNGRCGGLRGGRRCGGGNSRHGEFL